MKIGIKQYGDFKKTYRFLTGIEKKDFSDVLDRCGRAGVAALSSATPVDTGETASSWGYKVRKFGRYAKITWTNSNINNDIPVAILIQYGHGTNYGGYVEGIDYINPALQPIFKELADSVWKEVKSL